MPFQDAAIILQTITFANGFFKFRLINFPFLVISALYKKIKTDIGVGICSSYNPEPHPQLYTGAYQMKFIALFAIFVVFPIAAQASSTECLETLTHDNSIDSFSYTLNVDEINDRYFGNDHLASAIHYIKIVLNKKGCSRADVNFGRGAFGRSKSRCQYLAPGIATSLSCYVETNLGFFFITRDLMTHVHVVYSRWD